MSVFCWHLNLCPFHSTSLNWRRWDRDMFNSGDPQIPRFRHMVQHVARLNHGNLWRPRTASESGGCRSPFFDSSGRSSPFVCWRRSSVCWWVLAFWPWMSCWTCWMFCLLDYKPWSLAWSKSAEWHSWVVIRSDSTRLWTVIRRFG